MLNLHPTDFFFLMKNKDEGKKQLKKLGTTNGCIVADHSQGICPLSVFKFLNCVILFVIYVVHKTNGYLELLLYNEMCDVNERMYDVYE